MGQTRVTFKDEKFTYENSAYVYKYLGTGYTGLCGTQTLTSPYGLLTGIPKAAATLKPEEQLSIIRLFKEHLLKTGAFKEIQKALFENTAKFLMECYPNYSIMFGGRMNITKENYVNQLGVYSGSFARYLMKAKIGTITASHLHQNNGHKTQADFSIQQFFVWSPPTVDVLPINRSYVGIFQQEDHSENSIVRLEKKLGKTREWVMYRPRYFLKKPGETANDANVEPSRKRA